MKKLMLCLLIGLGVVFGLYAQSLNPTVVSSAGEVSKGQQISLEWTLGEVAVSTVRSPSGAITEGFHQPMLEVEDLGLENPLEDEVDITVAPNPVTSTLYVTVRSESIESGQMHLMDANGRSLATQKTAFPVRNEELDFSNYAAGMYYLSFLTAEGELIKTLKISKVQ